jgi:hypothetical protein
MAVSLRARHHLPAIPIRKPPTGQIRFAVQTLFGYKKSLHRLEEAIV